MFPPQQPSAPAPATADSLSALLAFLQAVGGGSFSLTITGTLNPAPTHGGVLPTVGS